MKVYFLGEKMADGWMKKIMKENGKTDVERGQERMPQEKPEQTFPAERLAEIHPQLAALAYENYLKRIAYGNMPKQEAWKLLISELDDAVLPGKTSRSENWPLHLPTAVSVQMLEGVLSGRMQTPGPRRAKLLLERGEKIGDDIRLLEEAENRLQAAGDGVRQCFADERFDGLPPHVQSGYRQQYLDIYSNVFKIDMDNPDFKERALTITKHAAHFKELLGRIRGDIDKL